MLGDAALQHRCLCLIARRAVTVLTLVWWALVDATVIFSEFLAAQQQGDAPEEEDDALAPAAAPAPAAVSGDEKAALLEAGALLSDGSPLWIKNASASCPFSSLGAKHVSLASDLRCVLATGRWRGHAHGEAPCTIVLRLPAA